MQFIYRCEHCDARQAVPISPEFDMTGPGVQLDDHASTCPAAHPYVGFSYYNHQRFDHGPPFNGPKR